MIRKIVLAFVYACAALTASAFDAMAADEACAPFRTGIMDPKVSSLPPGLERGLKAHPAQALPELVAWLCDDAESDFLKVKRIHDWITDRIAYDNDAFNGASRGTETLPSGRATCGGFAGLFRTMAELAGVQTRVIEGYSRVTYDTSTSAMATHIWNSVRIGGKWYIVDTTHDSRFSYTGSRTGPKSAYRDTWLFAAPEYKILSNIPVDPADQFLPSPVSMENFLAFPQVEIYWYARYGVEFSSPRLPGAGTGYRKESTGSGRYREVRDVLEAGKIPARIELVSKIGEPLQLHAELLDGDGKSVPGGAFAYLRDGRWTCLFSPPNPGRYRGYISAKNFTTDKLYNKIYAFTVEGTGEGGGGLPPEGELFLSGAFEHFGLKLLDHDFDQAGSRTHSLELEYPSTTSVFSWIWDAGDEKITKGTTSTVTTLPEGRLRVRYTYILPGPGLWTIKIRVKPQTASLYNDTAGFAKFLVE